MTTAAEIAARYGATVAPGCVVQKIPRGQSGLPQFVWADRKNALVLDMTAEQRTAMAKAANDRVYANMRAKAAKAQAEANDKVAAFHARGMTTAQMVEAGLTQRRVYDAYKALGLSPHIRATEAEIEARQKRAAEARAYRERIAGQIRACCDEGLSDRGIASRLSISTHMVERVRAEFGLKKPKLVKEKTAKAPRIRKEREDATAALCAAIAADHAAGLGWYEICAKNGISTHHLGMLNKHRGLGLACPPKKRTPKPRSERKVSAGPTKAELARKASREARAARQARDAEIERLRGEGMSLGRIAEVMGLPFGTVRSCAARAGIKAGPDAAKRRKLDPRINKHGIGLAMMQAQEARRAEIQRMADAGRLPTQRELADRFGISTTTINKDLVDMGLISAGNRPRGARAMTAAIVEMHRSGSPVHAICDTVGFSRSAVMRVLRRVRFSEAAQ